MPRSEDCLKFPSCNANVCPFDPEWRRRSHLQSEPVCLWLRERSKVGWEPRLGRALRGDQLEAVCEVYSTITNAVRPGYADLRKELVKAGKYGSRLEGALRLRRSALTAGTHD